MQALIINGKRKYKENCEISENIPDISTFVYYIQHTIYIFLFSIIFLINILSV